jgi:hypothetical protein
MSKQDTLQTYQAQLQTTADQVVSQMETAIVDYVQDRLTSFLLNGGLQQRLIERMSPVHQQFQQSLNALPDTRGQGFAPSGKQLKSAELAA